MRGKLFWNGDFFVCFRIIDIRSFTAVVEVFIDGCKDAKDCVFEFGDFFKHRRENGMPVFFFFLEADQRLSLFGDFDFSFDAVI